LPTAASTPTRTTGTTTSASVWPAVRETRKRSESLKNEA
jgi:hypothetical protein